MVNLTFGEQVKIVLSRKNMTIKELARQIEENTGKKMSRQNLTQRLSRDNFQEQDMRMIADILGCNLKLSILDDDDRNEKVTVEEETAQIEEVNAEEAVQTTEPAIMVEEVKEPMENERDITIGELVDIHEKLDALAQAEARTVPTAEEEAVEEQTEEPAEEEPSYEEMAAEEAGEEEMNEEPEYSDYAYEAPVYTEEVYEEMSEEPVEEAAEAEEVFEEPETSTEEVAQEIEALRAEGENLAAKEPEDKEKEKAHGWSAFFKRVRRKEDPVKAAKPEPVKEPEAPAVEQPEEPQPYDAYAPEEDVQAYDAYAQGEDQTYDEYAQYGDEQDYGQYEGETAYDEYAQYEGEDGYDTYGQYEGEPEYAEPYEEVDEQQSAVESEIEEIRRREQAAEDRELGEINPYTGREYETNSVRVHPKRIGYVQVYDRSEHKWTDMTEWAFLGYQDRKKELLGKDYVPPIYLD